ncbi:hypothetical protein ACHQM5_019474 [Ranunculus cassubicifolius]
MATSSVTLRGATSTLSRSYKNSPLQPASVVAGCSLSSAGKQRGISALVASAVNTPNSGKLYSKSVSPLLPLSNRRFICASSEVEAAVAEPNADPTPPPAPTDPIKDAAGTLDIRVGRIIKAWPHPEADSLYVEEVDVGEPETRTICSGLVKYIPLETLQDRKVIVLANLKPRNMRGVKSNGMLLCASDVSHENVELLSPPEDAVIGERIWFGLEEEKESQTPAATANQIQKKKIWESVQPKLRTDGSCVAALGDYVMRTSAGAVVSTSLQNANIG